MITVNVEWNCDEGGFDSLDLGRYTDNPNWSGIVFDRKTGKLTRNNVFGGIGARRYEDWSRTLRYIQLSDNYGKTRGACKYHLQDVDTLEKVNDGYYTVMYNTVTIKYKGLEIGFCALSGILEPDDSYKREVSQENLEEAKSQALNWIRENLKPELAEEAIAELEAASIEDQEL